MSDNTIRIDLSKSCDVTRFNNEALLQRDAYMKFNELLRSSVEVAENFDNITDEKEKKYKRHVHNAIFVGGSRGSGKTTFLVNVERGMDKGEDKSIRKDCLFLDIIDPTLLHNNEKFLSIVLGLLANYVDKHQECVNDHNSGDYSNMGIQEFYKNLQNAASAMETIENGKCSGVDAMIANQNGLQLEEYLNKVYSLFLKMFGKKLVVIRIDDIDMSFHHGYEVLETIRKYLSSPYVLPVICGDMKQYRLIVEREFASKGEYPKFNKDGTDDDLQGNILPDAPDEEFGERYYYLLEHRAMPQSITDGRINCNKYAGHIVDLTSKYLTKLFPKNKQISLHNVIVLLRKNGYAIIRSENNQYLIPFEKLFEFDVELRNYRINRNYDLNHELPNNARELFQYLSCQLQFLLDVMVAINASNICNKIKGFDIVNIKKVWANINCLYELEESSKRGIDFIHIYRKYLVNLTEFLKYDVKREQLYLESMANLQAIIYQGKSLYFDYKSFFIDDSMNDEYGFLTPFANPYFKVEPEYAAYDYENSDIWRGLYVNQKTSLDMLSKYFFYLVTENNYYTTNVNINMPFSGRLITQIITSMSPTHYRDYDKIEHNGDKTEAQQVDEILEPAWLLNFFTYNLTDLSKRPYLCELSRTKVDGVLDELFKDVKTANSEENNRDDIVNRRNFNISGLKYSIGNGKPVVNNIKDMIKDDLGSSSKCNT